ncbi:MAG: hypothetical protein ISS82_05050 [Nanoarchaeota archaeon]|nr:hypothetical protein [Nanoarchaeota archaeon]
MAKVERLERIKGLGTPLRCYAPFDEQSDSLKKAGAKYPYIMSIKEIVNMRRKGGPLESTRTCSAPVQAKDSPNIIAMVSPLIEDLDLAKQEVQAHRYRNYFVTEDKTIYDKLYSQAEEDKTKKPEERRAIILPEKGNYLIKPDTEEAKFILGKVQRPYFDEFVKTRGLEGITFYPINEDFVNAQNGTTINYLWFRLPDDDSGLDGYWVLNYDYGAFGVLKETSKDGSQKSYSKN